MEEGVEGEGDNKFATRLPLAKKGNARHAKTIEAQIFLDSGAIGGSYIREDVANALAKHNPDLFQPCITNVCGAFGQCQLSTRKIAITFSLINNNENKIFTADLKVLKQLPYDIILGRTEMRTNALVLEDATLATNSTLTHTHKHELSVATPTGGCELTHEARENSEHATVHNERENKTKKGLIPPKVIHSSQTPNLMQKRKPRVRGNARHASEDTRTHNTDDNDSDLPDVCVATFKSHDPHE